jgi:hypothetical protein
MENSDIEKHRKVLNQILHDYKMATYLSSKASAKAKKESIIKAESLRKDFKNYVIKNHQLLLLAVNAKSNDTLASYRIETFFKSNIDHKLEELLSKLETLKE